MATFDPQTAYAGDWVYFDDVIDAKYHIAPGEIIDKASRPTNQSVKVRPLSISSQRLQEQFSAVEIGSRDRAFRLWAGTGTVRDILPNDEIAFSGERWTVLDSREPNRSVWLIAARKVPNG